MVAFPPPLPLLTTEAGSDVSPSDRQGDWVELEGQKGAQGQQEGSSPAPVAALSEYGVPSGGGFQSLCALVFVSSHSVWSVLIFLSLYALFLLLQV